MQEKIVMMETPLDVLSRAATLVETDPKEGEIDQNVVRL